MADIVFTSITTPVGINCEDLTWGSSSEHMYTHFMWEQDCFGSRAGPEFAHWPLELIAANIRKSSVVLHWPSMDQLLGEIRTSKPQYVAMQVTTPTFERAENMTRAIKDEFPNVQVIYGGYAPEQGSADHWMKGEGISQFRKFLGEEQRGIVHPSFLLGYKWLGHKVGADSGLVFERVGCQNGCKFCATSAYHGGKGIYLMEVPQLKDVVDMYLRMGITNLTFFNEDHLNKGALERNAEFHEHVRSLDQLLNITGFSCMDSINQYDVDDLVDLGYYHLWTGLEDFSPQYPKNNYAKAQEFVKKMHEHGILMILSSMVGDPELDKQGMESVLDKVIGLGAYANQINILTPFEHTPLYEGRPACDGKPEVKKVEITDHRRKNYDGHHLVFRHPSMTAEEVEKLQRDAQIRDYYELGPSLVRAVNIMFNCYRHYNGTNAPRMKRRVENSADGARKALPLLDLAIARHPNPAVRESTEALRAEIIEKVGTPRGYWLDKYLVLPLGMIESRRIKREKRDFSKMRQPTFRRVEYSGQSL